MKAIRTLITLTSCAVLTLGGAAACGGDDDSTGDGDGDTVGDGDGDVTGDGDGDVTGDGDGDVTGDGDGDVTGDGDGDVTGDGDGDVTGDGDGDTGGTGGEAACLTILEAAAATEDLSSLVAAVQAAGIADSLMGEDLTVFAPTNDAFSDLLDALGLEFGDLTADNLIPILTYHVADSVVDSTTALAVAGSDENTFGTIGGTITLDVEDDSLVIDTDEAAATVVTADIQACNGVVHIIDQVLLPSITDIVVSQERFSGLETLIGLSETDPTNVAVALDGASADGAWTLFAPDNDAVQALIDADLGLTSANVTTALLYHAYSSEAAVGAATALSLDTVASGTPIATAGGEPLDVVGGEGVTLIDGTDAEVSVIVTDIYAANGIIHVIDGVLIPPSLD